MVTSDPGPFESTYHLTTLLRVCLTCMLVVGMVSVFATGLLFIHITYRLVCWKIRDRKWVKQHEKHQQQQQQQQQQETASAETGAVPTQRHSEQQQRQRQQQPLDLSLGLAPSHIQQLYQARLYSASPTSIDTLHPPGLDEQSQQPCTTTLRPREKPPNPQLLLIYNLITADVLLSAVYAINAHWLAVDGIHASSPVCAVQGWTVGFAVITTSGFLFTMSLFSYLVIIRGYQATQRDALVACGVVWSASILLASVAPLYFHGRIDELYGRETLWCWIAEDHKLWRLSIYLWGFPTMTGTCALYTLIYVTLCREGRSSRCMPRRRSASSDDPITPLRPSGYHPAFLIYPLIYTVTGTPLLLGTIIPQLERSAGYMATAGGLLASTGLLDALLWSSILVFSAREDLANTGLDQFAFVRTPEGRTLGNIVFVQGGGGEQHHRRSQSRQGKGWWRLGGRTETQIVSSSTEHLPVGGASLGDGIQMEVVTMVVSERRHDGCGGEDESTTILSTEISRDGMKSLGSSL